MMQNMIVPNSTFSIFASLLNENPDYVVVKPKYADHNEIHHPNWILLDYDLEEAKMIKWYKHCTQAFKRGRYKKLF